MVAASAEADADRPVVVDGSRVLVCAELECRLNGLARLLRKVGVRAAIQWGCVLRSRPSRSSASMTVLKAGVVYVPLDPQAPTRRLAYIAQGCEINLPPDQWREAFSVDGVDCIGSSNPDVHRHGWRRSVRVRSAARVSRPGRRFVAPEPYPPPTRTISLDIAYVLYAPGSTGA